MLKMSAMQVVWFAEIKWDYLRTRKHQLIRRRPRGVEVVYFEPYARGRENRYALRDEEGVRVALGSDSAASGHTVDVLSETQHLARARPDLEPRAVFRMATEWGARGLGF